MATTKTDAETPKAGGPKKWDGNAERDLCLAVLMATGESAKDWNNIHRVMTALGYDFTKDAMNQRWSKTIWKEFKSRHPDELFGSLSPKKTPNKRKKAADAAPAADEAAAPAGDEASPVVTPVSTPPDTPTPATKRSKRTPAKPKATGTTPAKPRGRKPKSVAVVKSEDDDDEQLANAKTEDAEQDQLSPTKKPKVEPEEEDTEMADEV
ncbi:hypothetical protein ISF_02422 [Cordyceps fumosorosea ARSEF 2679]|uniref:Myb-like domain-containing protein n=1 Tax=Cordyceps fumosorosea (strain ARSEF 2679) TaxID=1081104 RepID=A0A168BRD9_CORFA|nr:hypothetical protein ISF_02422 [Cordyceps fumosorosea ARSEF 2679]OAA70448.1 hypothetical protein ISF_02422 [Cordyceps fumosorosea ARSEF 2679]